jgi:hypothetical protein
VTDRVVGVAASQQPVVMDAVPDPRRSEHQNQHRERKNEHGPVVSARW